MRREMTKSFQRALLSTATLVLGVVGGSANIQAQAPEPNLPDIHERSGLLRRFEIGSRFRTNLPKDPNRDNYYNTRFGDHAKILPTNNPLDGGLYGVRLPARDTASVYPFFYGSPGESTITADSKPVRPSFLRAPQQFFHHRKPVGMYYDRGSYVPIYDLDSFSPGPGPDYWPWFFQGSRGG
jgi:hypothetical protein